MTKLRELRLELGDASLAGGDVRLGVREPRPVLLEAGLELGERDVGRHVAEELVGAVAGLRCLLWRLGQPRRLAVAGGDGRPARRVPALDLGAKTGAEALLGLQLDPVLLGERARQRGAGDVAALDQDLAEPLAGRLLRRQRVLELLVGQEALLDEKRAKRAPRVRRSHILPFGFTAALLEPELAPGSRYRGGVRRRAGGLPRAARGRRSGSRRRSAPSCSACT